MGCGIYFLQLGIIFVDDDVFLIILFDVQCGVYVDQVVMFFMWIDFVNYYCQ